MRMCHKDYYGWGGRLNHTSPLRNAAPPDSGKIHQFGQASGRNRSKVGLVSTKFGPEPTMLADFGLLSPEIHEIRGKLDRIRPQVGVQRPLWGRNRPKLAQVGTESTNLHRVGQNLAELRPYFRHYRSKAPRFGAELAEVGPESTGTPPPPLGNMAGRLRLLMRTDVRDLWVSLALRAREASCCQRPPVGNALRGWTPERHTQCGRTQLPSGTPGAATESSKHTPKLLSDAPASRRTP